MCRLSLRRGAVVSALLLALLVALPGCEVPGLLADMGGEVTPAQYELQDRPTLILVDDPADRFGGPRLTGLIANSAADALRENGVIEAARIVPQPELRNLAEELGPDFQNAPIDRLGRLLDAQQVIHVRVNGVSMSRAPGVFEPAAELEVKVIDAEQSRRLFPDGSGMLNRDNPPPGHRFTAQMQVRAPDNVHEGTRDALLRELADHTGQSVAELFYDHKAPPPGSTL